MKRSLVLLTTAVFLVAAGCAGSRSRLKVGQTDQGEVVEAEGFAPNDPGDILKTKRASLVDAQRNAVEKAVGVFVSGKTMVEQAIAIENNILARTEGYVKKYDVLSESVENGLYKTRIRALVAIRDLESDLKAMSLLKTPELQRPRVTVAIEEEVDGEAIAESPAASVLEKSLIDHGYIVVGARQKAEADLAIRGKASSHPFQAEGLGGFISYRARLTVKAVRPGSEDVVLSETKEASGLGGSARLAGFKSLETVGALAGSSIAEQLAESWKKNRNLLVFVEGVGSFSDVERVRKHLAAQPAINDLAVRLYEEQMAQFEVQLKSGSSAELAADLTASRTLPMTVLEAGSQTLRLRLN